MKKIHVKKKCEEERKKEDVKMTRKNLLFASQFFIRLIFIYISDNVWGGGGKVKAFMKLMGMNGCHILI